MPSSRPNILCFVADQQRADDAVFVKVKVLAEKEK